MHCLWKVYKAGGFHYYPPASVSQDCLCLHPISLTCSSLSFSSLLLLSSILYLCYPLCQLSSLLISLSLSACFSLSLCSLVLFAQTETLSAELKHYSSVFSVLDSPDWNIVCRVETSLTELKHYSFGSLVFSAELPWHIAGSSCALLTLSAELKHHLQSWNITLFGSLVFSAELLWQVIVKTPAIYTFWRPCHMSTNSQ